VSAAGVPPISSNEPIGPGASVARETDPIKLVMAAAFAWGANLPMYVFHSGAGVRSLEPFAGLPGIDQFVRLAAILPPELPAWVRNDGLEPAAPFTVFAGGQPGRYWPEVPGATTGAVRSTGKIKGDEFVSLPIGILAGGLELEARRAMSFQVFDPLTGAAVASMSRRAGERFTLARGPGAYIIKGVFTDAPSARTEVTVDLGTVDIADGMTLVANADGDTQPAAIGGRECRRNLTPAEDFYFYFAVDDGFAFQGSKPRLFIAVDYFDAGAGAIELQYAPGAGGGLAAK
jgi:hypothetical protein